MFSLLFFFEFFSFIATKAGLFLFNDTPTVYLDLDAEGQAGGMLWRNEEAAWGAWHLPNVRDVEGRDCFKAVYQSNSIGARDREFSEKSGGRPRIVLLGDSFAEGYGINADMTAESALEKLLDREVMNFGTGGDVGPLQYYLIYKNLAKRFQHDAVIVFLLPANDFTDNDYAVWQHKDKNFLTGNSVRYRPYTIKDREGHYDFFYPENAVRRTNLYWHPNPLIHRIQLFLIRYSWTGNFFRTLKAVLEYRNTDRQPARPGPYSGYFDATVEQQTDAIHWIGATLEESKPRSVTVVAIPTRSDIRRIVAGNNPSEQAWQVQLRRLEADSGGRMQFIDLAKEAPADFETLYLPCDGHWNEAGHRWAANAIFRSLHRLKSAASIPALENHHDHARP